jgi:hypothetical protein
MKYVRDNSKIKHLLEAKNPLLNISRFTGVPLSGKLVEKSAEVSFILPLFVKILSALAKLKYILKIQHFFIDFIDSELLRT